MAQEQRVYCNLSWCAKCWNFNQVVLKALHWNDQGKDGFWMHHLQTFVYRDGYKVYLVGQGKFNHVMSKGTKRNWVWRLKSESRDFYWSLNFGAIVCAKTWHKNGSIILLYSSLLMEECEKRPRGRWKVNIKVLLIDMRWVGVDGINLAQGRDESGGGLLWTP